MAYAQRADATLETELSTLANVYRFVLDCHAKKEATPESRPNGGWITSVKNTEEVRNVERLTN